MNGLGANMINADVDSQLILHANTTIRTPYTHNRMVNIHAKDGNYYQVDKIPDGHPHLDIVLISHNKTGLTHAILSDGQTAYVRPFQLVIDGSSGNTTKSKRLTTEFNGFRFINGQGLKAMSATEAHTTWNDALDWYSFNYYYDDGVSPESVLGNIEGLDYYYLAIAAECYIHHPTGAWSQDSW